MGFKIRRLDDGDDKPYMLKLVVHKTGVGIDLAEIAKALVENGRKSAYVVPKLRRRARYGWNKPHDSSRAKLRRLCQNWEGRLTTAEFLNPAQQNIARANFMAAWKRRIA